MTMASSATGHGKTATNDRARNAALAAALLGIVWIGFAGKLFSFNLNY